jgi:protein O-mannosyl-transferase
VVLIGPGKSSIKHSFLIPSVIAIFCYANILPNDFCFDDIPIVRHNPKIQIDDQWGAIWNTDYWSHSGQDAASRDLLYRPITLSVLRLTRIIAGNGPLAFHIISVLLHAICTLLVAMLIRDLLCITPTSCTAHRAVAPPWVDAAAWVAAAIFAVLPIHSEAVASVVGQADLLAAAGVIGTLLCHFRVAAAATWPQATLWMIVAAVCAFIAMGAKESGICVVPLVFLGELLGVTTSSGSTLTPGPLRGSQHGPRLHPSQGVRFLRAAYLVVPLGAYLALRYQALGEFYQGPAPTKTVNVVVDAPAWQRGLGVLQAWGMYWRKTIVPRELVIEYAINAVRLPTRIWQADVLAGLAWMMVLIAMAIHSWKKGLRARTFLVLALILSYLPTSNAFVLIQVFFAERIWYLPSVFVAGLFAVFGVRLLKRRIWRQVGVVILCAMMVRCWVRNSEWKNNGTLFAAAYYDHPQSVMARHLYGQWLAQNGEIEKGIGLIQKALEIDLGFTDAHRSLGHAYLKAGQVEDALRHLQIADMQAPNDPETQRALAEASNQLRLAAGPQLKALEQAARENPNNMAAQLAYVRMLRSLGLTADALKELELGKVHFADDSEWMSEWATTLVYLDRRDDAIEKYRRALELEANNAQLMVELGMLLLERRAGSDIENADRMVRRGLELQPESAKFHAALGEVLAVKGDIVSARKCFRRAFELSQPGSDDTRRLAERLRTLGE